MDLDFTSEGKVKVSMIKYLRGVIESLLETITEHNDSPEKAHIFDVR